MFMQLFIVHVGNERRVVIKEMHFLLVANGDVRVLAQKIMLENDEPTALNVAHWHHVHERVSAEPRDPERISYFPAQN